MKKVVIVGTVGIPACYGGFESLVENLTKNSSEEIEYTVFCSKHHYKVQLSHHNNAELVYLPLKANGIQSVFYDILSLLKCWQIKSDVVLILGVSGCLFLPIFKLFSNSKIVTNIDGLEWKRDKWGKWTQRFLKLSESIAVKFSDVIISDNQAISDYVYNEYNIKSNTIAYGGDHALRNTKLPTESSDYALALCRIEPENNIAMILKAFSKSKKNLIFVGNWNSSEFGKKLKSEYSKYGNIKLLDPIYNLDKLYLLRKQCSLYIHGHSAGGTNPSLVEMMHFGVTILAYDCNFNRYSTDDKAYYFKSDQNLIELLCLAADNKLESNGYVMQKIALEHYTWHKISKDYENTYYWKDVFLIFIYH
nr:DUF1972 domain-containing protein [Providencia rettgeri]